jgi:hypothetical protein
MSLSSLIIKQGGLLSFHLIVARGCCADRTNAQSSETRNQHHLGLV